MDYKKLYLTLIGILIVSLISYGVYSYKVISKDVEVKNICADDDLIARLIVDNSNPFSKFKFIKKRHTDCKILLINNKDDAEEFKNEEFCPYLDASTNSVAMLVHTYVSDMYDRETASKELKSLIPLMTPYDYCPQYYNNMLTLVKLKKRFGL
jgi:hypothetical protein